MREWAGPIGFVGAALSFLFWLVVPLTIARGTLFPPGQEPLYAAFVVLSLAGIAGALLARSSGRLAPVLLGLAVIPGIGALFIPGVLLLIAALLTLDTREVGRPGVVR